MTAENIKNAQDDELLREVTGDTPENVYNNELRHNLATFKNKIPKDIPPEIREKMYITSSSLLGFTNIREKDLPQLEAAWYEARLLFEMSLGNKHTWEMEAALSQAEILFFILVRKSVDGFESIIAQKDIREINISSPKKGGGHWWSRGSE